MKDLQRQFGWNKEGDPVMLISPSRKRADGSVQRIIISINDAWMFVPSEDMAQSDYVGTPQFAAQNMMNLCNRIIDAFGLGIYTSRKLAEIAWFVQEGLDMLLQLPYKSDFEQKRVAWGTVRCNGSAKEEFELTEDNAQEVNFVH